MRTTHTTIACCVFVLAVTPVVLTHCSGSSSTTPKANGSSSGGSSGGQGSSSGQGSSNGGTSSSGSSGDDGGGGTSSSSGGSSSGGSDDGGTVNPDGAASSGGEGGTGSGGGTPVPEGGAPSDPGSVSCGSSTCNTTTQHCCVEADGGTCGALNGSCTGGAGAVAVACNEAADCAPGNVCCQPLEYGPHSTTCMPSCPVGTYFQVCRADAECGTADAGATSQRCVVQTCFTSMAMTATSTIEACAYPTTTGGGGFPGGGTPGGGLPGGGGGGTTYGPLPNCH